MTNLPLSLACWEYDRTLPLINGEVKPDGIDLAISVLPPLQSFSRMLEEREFQVSELSLASYAALVGRGNCPFVGIPVPLSKMFRHSCIYIRTDAGIRAPEDLKGKRVGSVKYSTTGMVWIRGLLRDEYGIQPEDLHWFIGGLAAPADFAPYGPDANTDGSVKIERLTGDRTLQSMLQAGQLDALFLLDIPPMFIAASPRIARLFPNFKNVEQDYFRRTGIFPIMHIVVLRRDVYEQFPWAAGSLFRAFSDAKGVALERQYNTDALRLSLPWLIDHIEEARQIFGDDYWAYGIAPNLRSWATIGRYVYEQKLSPRLVLAEELFAKDAEIGAS
jgi:4,5-dihydroxyphthalate decarboxylase